MSQQIASNLENGSLLISDKFDINALITDVDATPYFNDIDFEYIESPDPIKDITVLVSQSQVYVFLQEINFEALKIQQKFIKKFIKNYKNFTINDDKFLRNLLQMILISGWAMTIANSSAPASQSEHLLAHTLTMKYPQRTFDILHGRMIASATILSLINQEKIVEFCNDKLFMKFLENFFDDLNNNDFSQEIIQYFGNDIALECIKEYNLKREYLRKNYKKIINNFQNNTAKIVKILNKNYLKRELLVEIFNHFDVDFEFEKIGFEDYEINDAQAFAKYIRNRITSSDFS